MLIFYHHHFVALYGFFVVRAEVRSSAPINYVYNKNRTESAKLISFLCSLRNIVRISTRDSCSGSVSSRFCVHFVCKFRTFGGAKSPLSSASKTCRCWSFAVSSFLLHTASPGDKCLRIVSIFPTHYVSFYFIIPGTGRASVVSLLYYYIAEVCFQIWAATLSSVPPVLRSLCSLSTLPSE